MNAQAPAYDEVIDMKLLNKQWDAYLEDYNNVSSKPMKLVMFQVRCGGGGGGPVSMHESPSHRRPIGQKSL